MTGSQEERTRLETPIFLDYDRSQGDWKGKDEDASENTGRVRPCSYQSSPEYTKIKIPGSGVIWCWGTNYRLSSLQISAIVDHPFKGGAWSHQKRSARSSKMEVITVIFFRFSSEFESFTSVPPTDSFLNWFWEKIELTGL